MHPTKDRCRWWTYPFDPFANLPDAFIAGNFENRFSEGGVDGSNHGVASENHVIDESGMLRRSQELSMQQLALNRDEREPRFLDGFVCVEEWGFSSARRGRCSAG